MRFDHEENSNLAILANRTLSGLASKSRLRHHIYVGRHSFYSHGIGITHEKRYWDQRSGLYDGVHLRGPTGCNDFTKSVVRILEQSLPEMFMPSTDPPQVKETNPRRVVKPKQRRHNKQ